MGIKEMKVHVKQYWMALAGASMMALALPLVAAEPEGDAVTTAVSLAQANAAASLQHWAEAAGFFEKAFGAVTGEVSDEAFSWLVDAGDDWVMAGDRAHAADAYRHAAAVAGATGRLHAMVALENKLVDVLKDIDTQHDEAVKTSRRVDTIGRLLAAGPAYPKAGPGWIKCEVLGDAMRWSRLGDDTGPRLLLPDVPTGGGGQEYLLQQPDGKRTKLSRKGAIDWIKATAQAAR